MSLKALKFTEYLQVVSFRLVMNFENRMSRAHGGLQKFDYKTALKILLYPLCRLGGGMNRTGISILQRFCNNIF